MKHNKAAKALTDPLHRQLVVPAKKHDDAPYERCGGEGWLEPIGPCADGSYITSRPCPRCNR